MTKRIVLLGGSHLSFLLARELDRVMGGFSHIELTLVTNSRSVIYPHQATLFGKLDAIEIKESVGSVRVLVTDVRSVNLRLREVITVDGVIRYDLIIIDQIAAYSEETLRQLKNGLTSLFAQLSSKEKSGQKKQATVIEVQGDDLSSVQLALTIKRDALSHHRGDAVVCYSGRTDSEISNFLARSGVLTKISPKLADLPKLLIKPPLPVVSSLKVKGAKVSKNTQLMTDEYQFLSTDKRALVIPQEIGQRVNLLSTLVVFARECLGQIQLQLDLDPTKKGILNPYPSYYLIGARAALLKVKRWQSERIRAALLSRFERLIWGRIRKR